jgi:hypothetical protein
VTRLGTGPVEEPDLLALIADPWTVTREQFAAVFKAACQGDADTHDGWVDPNRVRATLREAGPDYNPRQLSALWSVATSRDGSLGNTNKSVRLRKWRGWQS